MMPTDHILALLIAERDRLNSAIEVLQGPKRRGRPAKNASVAEAAEAPKRKGWTAAQKKAASARMKKRWATKKKAT